MALHKRLGPETAKNLEGVTDLAWHPTDPALFATVGGPGHERDIRVRRRVAP